jgi:phosphatidate phosphatase LPIN
MSRKWITNRVSPYFRRVCSSPEQHVGKDVVLDGAGYHSHGRERSDGTIRNGQGTRTPSPPSSSRSSPTRTPQQRTLELPSTNNIHFPTSSASTSSAASTYSLSRKDKPHFPSRIAIPLRHDHHIRSEPSLDTGGEHLISKSLEEVKTNGLGLTDIPVQEYSWEWGAFPQPSPMKTSFKEGRWETLSKGKAKARLAMVLDSDDEMGEVDDVFRSKSVPPELEGSPNTKRKELMGGGVFGYGDVDVDAEVDGVLDRIKSNLKGEVMKGDGMRYGEGGRLTAKTGDPTLFGLFIEGRTVQFELSIVGDGRASIAKIFDGSNEVEAASLFHEGKVTYQRFLEDDGIVKDERLVIRWAGDQCVCFFSCFGN